MKLIVDATCQIENAHIKGRESKGQSACGVLLIDDKNNQYQYGCYLGKNTVPEAEFKGLIFALEKAKEITKDKIDVFMDSQLVIRWLTGEYKVKKVHIKPLFEKVKSLEKNFSQINYYHHSRETKFGKIVDSLAREKLIKIKNNK